MTEKIVLTHKAKKAAKRLFKKSPHTTRPFSSEDYKNLPNASN